MQTITASTRAVGKNKLYVLIVDDNRDFVDSLARLLRHDERFGDVEISRAYSAEDALDAFREENKVAVLLSDIDMPGMSGIELIETVRKVSPLTVRILISGTGGYDEVVRAVNNGGIFHYLRKPCELDGICEVLRQGLTQYKVTSTEQELLDTTLKNVVRLLIDMLTFIAPEAHQRAMRVREIVARLCRRLKVKPNWNYDVAALLAQFSTVNVPEGLMERFLAEEHFSVKEREAIMRNARTVYDMLRRIPRLEYVAASVLYQHKHYDGKGYPHDEVSGKKIVFGGRLLKVAYDFDLSRQADRDDKQSFQLMFSRSGVYDPEILAALEAEVLGLPPGMSIRRLAITQLQEGMVTVFDILNTNGVRLLPAHTRLNAEVLQRLVTISENHSIVEPVIVYSPLPVEVAN